MGVLVWFWWVLNDNNIILLNSKLSSSHLSESETCDVDEKSAVRDDGTLHAHS